MKWRYLIETTERREEKKKKKKKKKVKRKGGISISLIGVFILSTLFLSLSHHHTSKFYFCPKDNNAKNIHKKYSGAYFGQCVMANINNLDFL